MDGRVIAVVNQKGGVAKTTSVLHLGAWLAHLGKRVLWVDLDPQAALSAWCGLTPEKPGENVYHGLMSRCAVLRILASTPHGPDIVPAGIELSLAELELVNQMAPERRLLRLIAPIRDAYDIVMIDTQPSLGLLTQNALVAADEVVIPVACEYLAVRVLDLVLRALGKVRVQANSRLRVQGILPTLYDVRTRHAREALEDMRRGFGARYRVFDWPVRKSIRFAEASALRKTVWAVAPGHPGGVAYQSVASVLAGLQPEAEAAAALEEDEPAQ